MAQRLLSPRSATLHVGLLRCGLFEAKKAMTFINAFKGTPTKKSGNEITSSPLPKIRKIILKKINYYKFGLISLHFAISGTMLSVTSSSRILQRCS